MKKKETCKTGKVAEGNERGVKKKRKGGKERVEERRKEGKKKRKV